MLFRLAHRFGFDCHQNDSGLKHVALERLSNSAQKNSSRTIALGEFTAAIYSYFTAILQPFYRHYLRGRGPMKERS